MKCIISSSNQKIQQVLQKQYLLRAFGIILLCVYLKFCYKFCINWGYQTFIRYSYNHQLFIQVMYLMDLDEHSKNYVKLTSEQFEAKYRPVEDLGSGTFGSVVKVISSQGQEFAIKKFNSNAIKNAKQIVREVDNLKRLEHPNIVHFYECFVVDDKNFRILLQYCEEGNLETFIQNNKVSQLQRLKMIRDIAQGLAYAHQQKIVHRDLKPQNIFIGRANKAKIGDFGCSILIKNQHENMESRIGSYPYMDNRIMDNNPYDMTVDIYAFGLIIFYIYKGKGLYDECQSLQLMQKIKSSIYKDYDQKMEQLTADLPYGIKNLIKNCIQVDHSSRSTAREISRFIEKEIALKQKQLDIASKSTQEEAEIEDQESLFIIEVLKLKQYLEKKQKIQNTKRRMLSLLNQYKQKMEETKELQTIKYIDPKCKQRLVAYIYFYYLFWLNKIYDYVEKNNSIFQQKYSDIDPEYIESDFKEQLRKMIATERNRYKQFFVKCCREINTTLRLLNQKSLPSNFKEVIKAGCLDYEKLDAFQDHIIREQVYMLFTNQAKKDYERNRGSDSSEDERFIKIEKLCRNL